MMGCIDDAARGPAIGPLCLAMVSYNSHFQPKWPPNTKDSKNISNKSRETTLTALEKMKDIIITREKIDAKTISERMLKGDNLDDIVSDHLLILISKGPPLQKIFMDHFGYGSRIKNLISETFQIPVIMETQAESKFQAVAAASIVAKCHREQEMTRIRLLSPFKMGSGYPSDLITQKWLLKNAHPLFGYPDYVRTSWRPVQRILKDNADKISWSTDLGNDATSTVADSRSIRQWQPTLNEN